MTNLIDFLGLIGVLCAAFAALVAISSLFERAATKKAPLMSDLYRSKQ